MKYYSTFSSGIFFSKLILKFPIYHKKNLIRYSDSDNNRVFFCVFFLVVVLKTLRCTVSLILLFNTMVLAHA